MEKYLHHYAEPEAVALGSLPGALRNRWQWTNVVVIPACNEGPAVLRAPPASAGRSLLILVINESLSACRKVSSNNRALAAVVQARLILQWQFHADSNSQTGPGFSLSLLRDPLAARDVLLVDRFSAGRQLPARGGVGQARKIGADLATSLIQRQCIRSAWIHCTDADAQLPKTYFRCSDAVPATGSKYAALIYPFRHCADPGGAGDAVFFATQLYELALRYYVAGMKFAGSPYAFHTIGSTLAVNARHYAQVRGFPKRQAGEDFYLLNKLAKVGAVLELRRDADCEPIRITARRSDRVPFGTGAAVNKIAMLAEPVRTFRFYHPEVFELLRLWLQSLPAIWRSQSVDLTGSVTEPCNDDQGKRQQLLLGVLQKIGVDQALGHAFRQSRDLDQFTRQMHTWFDAFRTLKLIHTLRDQYLPSVSYTRLTAAQTFHQLLAHDADLTACHRQFRTKFALSGDTDNA